MADVRNDCYFNYCCSISPVKWRVFMYGYYSTSRVVCHVHLEDLVDELLQGEWADYTVEVRRI